MPDFKIFKPKKDKNDNNENGSKASKKEKGKLFSKPRGKLPTKTTINLAISHETSVSAKRLIPVIVIAVFAVLILGKFFIYDRINNVVEASNEVTDLQNQLQTINAQIASYGNVEEDYAHYTTSGMTEEELGLVDRVEIMKLVERVIGIGDTSKSWSLTGNVLTIQLTGTSLQQLNELSRSLENEIIVDRCMITTANKVDKLETQTNVTATFNVYLRKPIKQEDQAAQDNSTIQNDADQIGDQVTGEIADQVTDEITQRLPEGITNQGVQEIGGENP